ncbi:glycosyltransferase family 2 protein [Pseudemcibacter aquimaris]|uniref:glycosyltransferase family 2 protein n=1 Tax=Pseudemcibacter aquimaris TaxID=2857064 RepID=UPI00201110B3|nr:glycosyltransferase family 2 protein [Pseudemcibacter aquimaris]MCC3861264.1 glycosyltransferase family 2 protein [Pseudemcibacter aquimaris]WDU58038.1 glycosyltransferase family 2 protein [Pseudemcibacter aquimaris]
MTIINEKPELSVVIPLYNEQDNVAAMSGRLIENLEALQIKYEVIFIDDGSRDATWDHVCKESSKNSHIKAIRFSRNFGHQRAIYAGLKHAEGEAVISMDGDLQHPPELIHALYKKWKDGYNIVNTVRRDKAVSGSLKRVSSKLYYKIFSLLSSVEIEEGSSDFRLIDRQVLKELLSFGESDIFLRGAIQWVGFNVATIEYDLAERHSGKTKFTFSKMMQLASSGIVSYSTLPLKIGVWIGMITGIIAFFELGYIFFVYLKGETVPGWASTLGVMSLLFGILFFVIGLMGIYIGRIHNSLQQKPTYIIKDKIN